MKEQLQLKDFLQYHFLSNVQFSPDGKQCVYVKSQCHVEENNYQHYLYLFDGKTHCQLTGTGKESLYIWEDDTTLLFSNIRDKKDQEAIENGEERSVFYRLSLNGGEAYKAFTIPLSVMGILAIGNDQYVLYVNYDLNYSHAYTLDKKEQQTLLETKKEMQDYEILDELPFYGNGQGYINKTRSTLFFYDAKSQDLIRISENNMDVGSYQLNDDKTILYFTAETFITKAPNQTGIYSYDFKAKVLETCYAPSKEAIYRIQPWGDELLVVASPRETYGLNENPNFYWLKDKQLHLMASWEETFGSSVGSDCRLGSGKSAKLVNDTFYFITTKINDSHLYGLDKTGNLFPVLEKEGSIDLFDIHEKTMIYVGMHDLHLQELYQYNLETKQHKKISHYNDWVQETKDIRPIQACHFQQGDLELYGWVITPRNYQSGTKYPAILDIHGGPKTVYGTTFTHEMQVWANLGYFVFFMNPRGGDGRGNAFADLRGKYGTIDYDDLMAFTDIVLERYPDIDDKRLGVTGGSYGGFMTNWIIGHTDRFKAAASQRSIANWISFAHTSDIGESFGSDQMAATTWGDVEKLWWHSPLKYANQVKTPTLFIHSNEDYRCPYSEGMQMYSALVENGVETRLCMFKGENHELSRSGKPKHRIKRLEEITNWMEKYLK